MKKYIYHSLVLLSICILGLFCGQPACAQSYNAQNIATGGLYTALTKDTNGNIYLIRAVSSTNYELVKYTNGQGQPTVLYSGLSHEAGSYPWGLAVATNGQIFVSTSIGENGNRILKLTNSNGIYTVSDFQSNPVKYYTGLAIDVNDRLYALQYDGTSYEVVRYNNLNNGSGYTSLFSGIPSEGGLSYATNLAIATNGDVYYTDPFCVDESNTALLSMKGGVVKVANNNGSYDYATKTYLLKDTYASALSIESNDLYALESTGTAGGYKLSKYSNMSGTGSPLRTDLKAGSFIYPWGVVFKGDIGYYTTGDDGNSGGSVMRIVPNPNAGNEPSNEIIGPVSSDICANASTSFSLTTTGATAHQWEVSTDGGNTYNNVLDNANYNGAITANLSIINTPASFNTYIYRCKVTFGVAGSKYSSTANLFVTGQVQIDAQPVNTHITTGGSGTFSVAASGATSYQWQQKIGGGSFVNISDGGGFFGVNSATLQISNATLGLNGVQFQCVVSNLCSVGLASNVATLTVNTAPSISQQPGDKTVMAGDQIAFTMLAAGATGYQWQVSTGAGFTDVSNGALYSGVTSNTLTITAPTIAMNGYLYRCIVTGAVSPDATSLSAKLTVTVPPNQPPIITNLNGDAVGFTEGSSAVLIDVGNNATVTDSDSPDFNGGNVTVSIVANRVSAEDVLSIRNEGTAAGQIGISGSNVTYEGTTIGTWTGGTGANDLIISFNGNANPTSAQALIRNLTYMNTNDTDPSTAVRTVAVTINDGDGGTSAAANVTVQITAVNDAPTMSSTATNPTFTEGAAAVSLFSGTSISTVEAGQLIENFKFTVANVFDGSSEIINIDGKNFPIQNGTNPTDISELMVTINLTGTNAVFTVSSLIGKSAAVLQGIINGITYRNTSTNPNTTNRIVKLSLIQDNGGTANGGVNTTSLSIASTVTLVAVNNAPVATTSGGNTTFTEGASGVAIDGALTLSDPDNTTFASATVAITGNFQSGQDVLVFTYEGSTMGNIATSYNAGTGVLTMTSSGASATIAQWQTALRAVKYDNSSQNPNTATRSISFKVSDGNEESAAAIKTVSVVAVNDAPIAMDDYLTLTEDTPRMGNVLTNDSDPEGNTLTASLVTAPVNGTVVLNADGSFTYTPNANYSGRDSLQYQVCDNGLPSKCDTAWLHLAINPVNDAPVVTAPASITVTEDVASALTGISFSDVDAGANDVTVLLLVPNGTLQATTGSGVIVSGMPSSLVLNGAISDINAFIAGGNVSFTTASNATTDVPLSVSINDNGHTGVGGAKTASVTIILDVTAVNDAPVATNDSYIINEDVTLTVPAPGILANDTDVDSNTLTAVLVTGPTNGTLTLNANGSFTYTPNANFNGTDSFTYRASDGAAQSNIETVTITVNAVNDAPVITAPNDIVVVEDEETVLKGFSFADVDAGTNHVLVTLYVSGGGTLRATSGSGVTVGGTSPSLTLTGSISDINAFIAGDNIRFTTASNSTLTASLNVEINDLGNTGGDLKTDSEIIMLLVTAVNDAPVNSVPGAQSVDQDATLTFSTGNNNLISISDVDAGSLNVQVALTATNGRMTLVSTDGLIFLSGSGTSDVMMTFRGTIVDINTALNGLVFTPTPGYNGPAYIQIITDDLGNTGSGGAKTDTDNIAITVNSINPKVISVSASTANGTYKIDDVITLTVTFDQTVMVNNGGGIPTLLLETGAIDREANYVSGTGGDILTFSYKVQAADISADLDYTSTTALALNGAAIKNVHGDDAILTLPTPGSAGSLGANSSIVIDGIVPTVTSVTVPANGYYLLNQNLDFTVNFSEAVILNTVGGTPLISLTIGGQTTSANYLSGSGSSALVFRYTVATGLEDHDGIAVGALSLNGGTISDIAGNNAVLTLNSVGDTRGVKVDSKPPVVSGVAHNGLYNTNRTIVFNEGSATLNGAAFAGGTVVSAEGNYTLVVTDAVGNSTTLQFEIDKTAPIVTGVTHGGVYNDNRMIGFNEGDATLNGASFVSGTTVSTEGNYTLIATDAAGNSTTVQFEIDKTAPMVPAAFVATGQNGRILLTWSANTEPDLDKYILYVKPEGGVKVHLADVVKGTEHYTYSGLPNGKTYEFYLVAADQVGNQSAEALASAKTMGEQTINFATLTDLTYGQQGVVLTASASSNLPVSFTSSDPGIAQVYQDNNDAGKWKINAKKVGTVTITATQAGNNEYLPATAVGNSLTIVPADLIVTAEPKSKVYGESDPVLTYTVKASDLRNGDAASVVTGTLSRAIGENVGSYAINNVDLTANNYSINYEPTDLTITKADLTVTADAKSKVYGESDPVLTYTVKASDLRNGDAASVVTGTLSRAIGENVGSYAINNVDLTASNYSINYEPADLTITKADLIVTADAKSKVYGESDPVLTYTVKASDLRNGDAASVVTGTLSRAIGENVGSYAINNVDLTASNYSINYEPADLTITKADLIVTAEPKSKVYGEADPVLTYTVKASDLRNGDAASVVTGTLSRAIGENVGSYAINNVDLTANNYSINYESADLTITKADLTVTAEPKSKVYGGADPVLTYTVKASDLRNGDVASVVTGTLSRAIGENVGSYAINNVDLTANNYSINYEPADLTITKADLTVTAELKSKVYGGVDPVLTYTVKASDLRNGDAASVVTGTLSRAIGENVGSYAINNVDLTANNYSINYQSADLTITKADLTVTAELKSKVYGESDPVLTYMVKASDLRNGDAASVVTGTLSRVIGENVGNYEIHKGNLSAGANYQVNYVGNNFEITKATLKGLRFENKDVVYDGTVKSLQLTGTLPNGVIVSYQNNDKINTGSYEVKAVIAETQNYFGASFTARLDIRKAKQTISFVAPETLGRDAGKVALDVQSSSGLPVVLSVDDPMVATVSGTDLNVLRLGTVRVTAVQTGNENYEAASPVTVSVRVANDASAKLPIRVHQALSPNGDGINEFLIIEGIRDYTDNKVTIFDKNGVVLAEIEGYDNRDRVFFGNDHRDGTYFYYIDVRDNGVWKREKGYFVIRR
ncbi:MBG domain-containing protein [Sphingobacterium yanglingense]|uniref:Gliding motility-associated-like protein n=1 Tax=Sphingobacterium yanglingense TaxID=1437280 RepID=A0A4V6PXB5_9SPHI|nr:MBG domain-containing protein [Sphingobacterium yanglingense]TDQ73713.1 gliding motility-associated-like protein [Sphingobacterium yanglingense]